ncbi:transposase [Ruminococcaceae bacterium OttesenSCG-928-D13]|nr:transposase [Ruminococcaceae bacterium OttesenSCG-928-D13]
MGAFAQSSIVPYSTIQSDALLSYRKPLAEKCLHQYSVYDPQSGLSHWLHTLEGNAKAAVIGTFHGLAPKHLQRYLNEFRFCFNRRFFHGNLFFRLLNSIARSQPCRFLR